MGASEIKVPPFQTLHGSLPGGADLTCFPVFVTDPSAPGPGAKWREG